MEKLCSEESTERSDNFVFPNIDCSGERKGFWQMQGSWWSIIKFWLFQVYGHSKWSSQSSRKPERSM